jgi:hypothetical protein
MLARASLREQKHSRTVVCFSTAGTRDKIQVHGLFEPFQLMRATASRLHAEAIGVKLCRWHENLIYELSLLRHDASYHLYFCQCTKRPARRFEE